MNRQEFEVLPRNHKINLIISASRATFWENLENVEDETGSYPRKVRAASLEAALSKVQKQLDEGKLQLSFDDIATENGKVCFSEKGKNSEIALATNLEIGNFMEKLNEIVDSVKDVAPLP